MNEERGRSLFFGHQPITGTGVDRFGRADDPAVLSCLYIHSPNSIRNLKRFADGVAVGALEFHGDVFHNDVTPLDVQHVLDFVIRSMHHPRTAAIQPGFRKIMV